MGDDEVPSRSGQKPQMSPPVEATSPSETEEGEQPKCPGHGRGRGTSRGHTASSSTPPGTKRVIKITEGKEYGLRQDSGRQSCHGCTNPRHNNMVAQKWHLHLKKLPALHQQVTGQTHGMTIPSAPPALMSNLHSFCIQWAQHA